MKSDPFTIKPWASDLDNIFLVGSPRSGTTWLQAMLATHPAIYTGIETHFFSTFSHFLDDGKRIRGRTSGLAAYLSPDQVNELVRGMFWVIVSNLPEPEPIPQFFLEKTPDHCFYVKHILSIFPKAKFIHLIRDARMVVHSMLEMSKRPHGYWAPNTIEKAVKQWKNSVLASREIKKLTGADQYYEVKYEDLREDPHHNLQSILNWLKIDVNPPELDEIVKVNSLEEIKRKDRAGFATIIAPKLANRSDNRDSPKIYGKGNFQSGNYGLTKAEKKRVDYLVGDLLVKLGYHDVKTKFYIYDRLLNSRRLRKWLQKIF